MKYIVCEEPGKFSLKEKDRPEAGEGEVLLDIKRIGICGTDIHAYGGNQAYFTYPRILGHELAAEILETNGSVLLTKGEKVVVIPYINCGTCIACRAGRTNCCASLKVLGVHTDGGMQETIAIAERLLIPTPNLSYEEMAIVEPLSIAAHAIGRAEVEEGETVLVIGCGPIGLALMIFAKLRGARVLAMDINRQRLDYARNEMGVDEIIVAGNGSLEQVKALTSQDFCKVVIDATGNKLALESGPAYLAHGGRYVLVGLSKGELLFNHPAIHAKETTVLCSRNATKADFEEVIRVLSSGLFPSQSYITHQADFSEMIAGFDSWLHPESQVIKAMVTLGK